MAADIEAVVVAIAGATAGATEGVVDVVGRGVVPTSGMGVGAGIRLSRLTSVADGVRGWVVYAIGKFETSSRRSFCGRAAVFLRVF